MPKRFTLALALCLAALPAAGQDRPVSPAEFEAMVTGRTLTYASRGGDFGAEEYREGRRVVWSYLDGDCADGEWYASGEQVCFVYDGIEPHQCWQFYLRDGRLLARFENDPDATELYETRSRATPLYCLGPEVGA